MNLDFPFFGFGHVGTWQSITCLGWSLSASPCPDRLSPPLRSRCVDRYNIYTRMTAIAVREQDALSSPRASATVRKNNYLWALRPPPGNQPKSSGQPSGLRVRAIFTTSNLSTTIAINYCNLNPNRSLDMYCRSAQRRPQSHCPRPVQVVARRRLAAIYGRYHAARRRRGRSCERQRVIEEHH